MKRTLLAAAALIIYLPLLSQYYLRGEVRDQQGNPLPNVKITLFSKGSFPYYSGSSGAFGIPTSLKTDTITLVADGYEVLKTPAISTSYNLLTLRLRSAKNNSSGPRLFSLTKNFLTYKSSDVIEPGESYASTVENDFVESRIYPETGFAVNVDRASYSNIRRFIKINSKTPTDAVRIEEMLNYFNFGDKNFGDKDVATFQNGVFSVQTTVTSCPWNAVNQLLFINIQAKKINLDKTPASNFVFLIDVSGSMEMQNRLPLLKSAFRLLVKHLRSIDTVSIITYGNDVAVRLQPTGGNEKQKIIEAIEDLTPAGSTPGESAIRLAYQYARNTFVKGGNNRVILATDGDFNVGQTSEQELEALISKQQQSGIYLTCLGVGMGNYKDSKLEILAKRGNGNFAYLDCEKEAEKVLVEEFAQTLYTVADDVYVTANFNPAMIRKYRLIGFDNPRNAVADSSVQLEGGEVGSGNCLLVVFEMVPTEQNLETCKKLNRENIASLKFTYKTVGKNAATGRQDFTAPLKYVEMQQADSSLRFASAVIMFGSLLKQSKFAKDIDWDQVPNFVATAANSNDLLKMEFMEMVQKAKKIYSARRKK